MAWLKTVTGVRIGVPLALGISASVSALALLSGCDNGPSAVRQQSAGTQMASAGAPQRTYDNGGGGNSSYGAPQVDHRKDQVAKADDGKPVWAPSRKNSAEDGAERAFERNGEAFGAKSVDQFVQKAHAFVGHPPKGTLTLTRKNGDTLFYDPKDNIFAVANKEGAPRTMFKPDDGMAYWEKQKATEQKRQARRSRSSDDQA
jgi:pyocin large subunit-like protein